MRYLAVFALMVATLVDQPAAAQAAPRFKWQSFPTGQQFNDYYPKGAAANKIEGKATVTCKVIDADGRLRCTVLGETPTLCGDTPDLDKPVKDGRGQVRGYPTLKDNAGNPVPLVCGFGEATVKVIEAYGRADMTAPGAAIGDEATTTAVYQIT